MDNQNMIYVNWFLSDYQCFLNQMKNDKNNGSFALKLYPILIDKFDQSGTAKGHYFFQDLIVAQKIFKNNPEKHVDIGSRMDGFISHVASFRSIEVFDIRPIANIINNINYIQADLMNFYDEKFYNYTDSISALHSIEHFGLGRYGDPVDFNGHIKGLDSIYKILKKGGKFYFSVPIGQQRIEFNAHRVFSLRYLLSLFESKYILQSFSYVDDNEDLHQNIDLNYELIQNNCHCNYGCGIFEFVKI
jgi:SAM-dependent methyltransferase